MKITYKLSALPPNEDFYTELDIFFGKGIEIYNKLNQIIDISYQSGKIVVEFTDSSREDVVVIVPPKTNLRIQEL